MPKKRKSSKQKPGAKKRPKRASSRAEPPSVSEAIGAAAPEEAKRELQRYSSSVVARGEAVPAGDPLPPGATHEIVGHDADGAPVLKRRRFSTF